MRYLLDTNICIYLMKVHSPEVVERFRKTPQGLVGMSVVTYAELRRGVECCPTQDRVLAEQSLNRFVALVPVIAMDQRAAESYGIIAAAIRDRRRDALDRLIAAHAISIGATLITNNEADFKDYPGLSLENWVNPPPTL
jgi:tRNA(fMet)-specific endonuclease VapC